MVVTHEAAASTQEWQSWHMLHPSQLQPESRLAVVHSTKATLQTLGQNGDLMEHGDWFPLSAARFSY